MSFPRYPEYKDSGVEWLGEVPAHWSVKPLKYLTSFINGMAFKPGEWSCEGTPIIRIENLNDSGRFNFYDGEVDERYHVKKGDLLFGWSGNKGTSFGPCVWGRGGVFYLNQHIFRLADISADKQWLYWTLKAVTETIEDQAHGIIGMVHVTKGKLGGIPVPDLPKKEQQAIAAFLDHETARIDALVEEQQRLIELLREKRQAVISHAVTKGLDPGVSMKDSGVEWLGEVPEHWDVKSLMHLTPPERKIMYGIVLPGPDFDGGVPIIKGGDVKPGRLSLEKLCRTDPKIEARYERSRVDRGDIVYSIRGGIGDVELVPEEIAESNLTQDAARVAPRDGVFNTWLLYALKSDPVFAQLEAKATGATIRGINIMDLKRATLPVPPLQEQQQIAEKLGFIIGKLDRLEKEAGAAITLMQEHRSALISAAVTGKIDVRGWQPPEGSTESSEATQTEMV